MSFKDIFVPLPAILYYIYNVPKRIPFRHLPEPLILFHYRIVTVIHSLPCRDGTDPVSNAGLPSAPRPENDDLARQKTVANRSRSLSHEVCIGSIIPAFQSITINMHMHKSSHKHSHEPIRWTEQHLYPASKPFQPIGRRIHNRCLTAQQVRCQLPRRRPRAEAMP